MGRNNKSIHLLRGDKNNHPSEVLDLGQPFYDKYGRSIYIGDGNTSLGTLTPISGGWDYIDKGEASTAGYHFILSSKILSKIRTAGFLHCSHNGNVVAIQGLNRDDGNAVTDIWHLIYVHNSPNSTLKDGAILAVGDTAGVFYGTISGESITWGRLTNQSRLSYTGKDSNTYVELNKNSLTPSTPNSVNLGSGSNLFNTVYANYFSVPGTCFNFRYDNDTAEEDKITSVRYGYEYRRPSGNIVPIKAHLFMDGSGEDGEGHLTWIKAKGLVPYQSNEINFNLESDSNNLVFGASNSTKTISRYEFKDGKNNTFSSIVRGSVVLNGGVDSSTTYDFTVGGADLSVSDTVIPAWSKGVCVSSGNDASIWCTNKDVTKFLFYNKSEPKWHLSSIEAPSFNATSDKRLKENIVPFTSEKSILDLPVYTFNFKSDKNKKKHVGCLAQDLQEICPDLVNEDSQGYLSIEESKITYLLLEEVKELKKRVKELEEKISNEEKVPNNSNNLSSSSNVLGDR